ncbi:anhydro-N-acetylmuramic acid kinase [Formosa algae]|uniref:Anhydro-N-acetylmuramic acid kinase n=1 Tax=Formosa algae TaxID=225843 RepID=A0A9X0YLC7_9FLAO|nr:anhydro-N-acetylmuramic acid kinase [Formosa algae]MBP1839352.1 anhydro-N-acetylmuramic acid kinase [Formosa algae]MDQ0334656.1 anhydro-N-acetylmuramic acid kinase [Formosa algae]OEI81311.1 anhydro-N-acetylmuramic acid kinase [Formosa algae]
MIKEDFKVIGVMSGTSLDGIDVIYADFKHTDVWNFSILKAETIPYTEKWLDCLKHLVTYSKKELEIIDQDYTVYLANVIQQFIEKYKITDIDAVCSHGHTALHDPAQKFTYQIGNLPKLADLLQKDVVCDFRVQDVALGGQGAPLVPIGDALLFSNYDFCLNLGGFANISTEVSGERIAFDICPVNIVLNHYVQTLGFDYDDGGKLASIGMVHAELLHQLNALPFYKADYPKSLGLEWVVQNIFPLIDAHNLDVHDILRTFVEHIAIQIAKILQNSTSSILLITGGGAYNVFLIERLKSLSTCEIIIPEAAVVEYKEALIFGLLGILKLKDQINCLKSVTGATENHSTGVIYSYIK